MNLVNKIRKHFPKYDNSKPYRLWIERLSNTLYITDKKEEQESYELTWKNNINLCQTYIDSLESQITKTEQDFILRNKAKELKEIMKEIDNNSMLKLKNNILIKTNDRIKKILKRSEIKISKIGNHLILEDRRGVSEGQKLSIAYAFSLTTKRIPD